MSLYNKGMKIAIHTESEGWFWGGDNIVLLQNQFINEANNGEHYYSLKFQYEFKDESAVYFAYSIPYIYSQLKKYLNELVENPITGKYLTKEILCKTVSGINCEYVVIKGKEELKGRKKRAVIFTARVHPGETAASWMMKGVIDFLVSECPNANLLRENFVFIIIPMLNPDGVKIGRAHV